MKTALVTGANKGIGREVLRQPSAGTADSTAREVEHDHEHEQE